MIYDPLKFEHQLKFVLKDNIVGYVNKSIQFFHLHAQSMNARTGWTKSIKFTNLPILLIPIFFPLRSSTDLMSDLSAPVDIAQPKEDVPLQANINMCLSRTLFTAALSMHHYIYPLVQNPTFPPTHNFFVGNHDEN